MGLRADKWVDVNCRGGEPGAFDRYDHQILRAEVGRIVGGDDFARDALRFDLQDQAVILDRLEMCSASDNMDFDAGFCQTRSNMAAYSSSAEYGELHQASIFPGFLDQDIKRRLLFRKQKPLSRTIY